MTKRILWGAVLATSLTLSHAASALVIDSTSVDGTAMANSLLGSGINISNVNYSGGTNQSGFFSGGNSLLGIDSGLIMTSGDANLATGPNNEPGETGATGGSGGGDADLDSLIPESTNDAAVLTFDFVTTSGDLFFNYVFASEEYNEYVSSDFNDVFAFFVNDTNIAIAPDGNPVSVNNVNCGNPYTGAGPNCEVYNNNDASSGPPAFDIQYDGFTDKLTASILGLESGVTHQMKIAIADAGDNILDSAVFLEAGSFSDIPEPPVSVPEPGSLLLMMLGFGGLVASRRRLKG